MEHLASTKKMKSIREISEETNNFYIKLPRGVHRVLAKRFGLMDQQHLLTIQSQEHSRLFLEQTRRQFYRAIDKTLLKLGQSLEELAEMSRAYDLEKDEESKKRLLLASYETYLELLKKGYSRYDLTK